MVVCSLLEHSALPNLWQGTNTFLLTGDYHERHAVCSHEERSIRKEIYFFIKKTLAIITIDDLQHVLSGYTLAWQ